MAALPLAMAAALKGLAHELRNPLAGLKGAAQLLARRIDPADAAGRELVGLVGSEVDRLTGLLDRLLDPAPPRPHVLLNLHAVLERVLRLAESDAGWAVRLVRDYDPSLPELQVTGPDGAGGWNIVAHASKPGPNKWCCAACRHAARIAASCTVALRRRSRRRSRVPMPGREGSCRGAVEPRQWQGWRLPEVWRDTAAASLPLRAPGYVLPCVPLGRTRRRARGRAMSG